MSKYCTPLALVDNGTGALMVVVDADDDQPKLPQGGDVICRLTQQGEDHCLSYMNAAGRGMIGPFTTEEKDQLVAAAKLLVAEFAKDEITAAREVEFERE